MHQSRWVLPNKHAPPGMNVQPQLQVLKPTTLVGTELKPPVGHAKDWMWNGDTVVHTLTRLLGPAGATLLPTERHKAVSPCLR